MYRHTKKSAETLCEKENKLQTETLTYILLCGNQENRKIKQYFSLKRTACGELMMWSNSHR